MARPAPQFTCTACGAVHRKWAGRCEACGAWNSIVEEAPLSVGPKSLGGQGPHRSPLTDLATEDAPPPRASSGHGRAGPGAGRRPGAGLGHSGRRRSGHRQIHAAVAGRGQLRPRRAEVPLHLGRGSGGAGADARAAAGPADAPVHAGGRNQPARHPDHAGRRTPGAGHHRFDPDHVAGHRRERPRLGQPGARGGA